MSHSDDSGKPALPRIWCAKRDSNGQGSVPAALFVAGGWNLKRLHESDTEIPVLVREEGFEPPTASV
jgi:hypothetical protein